ncbi:MAG: hypothetical protein ACI9OJ_000946 [Myxococcota bacterium]|jgi:hypothetical protein
MRLSFTSGASSSTSMSLALTALLLLSAACSSGSSRRSSDATTGSTSDDAGATTSTDGTSGTDATTGTTGTDGTSAVDGTSGTAAVDGTDGTTGTSATEGTDGTTGTSATEGTDGTEGTSATEGTDGTTGATDGTDGCVPACGDKQCGSDGCGGQCGGCPPNSVCEEFTCVEETGSGACQNDSDTSSLGNDGALQSLFNCGLECEGESECTASCVNMTLGLSNSCAGCVGEVMPCIVQSCFDTCSEGANTACTSCANEACGGQFFECSGLQLPTDDPCKPSCGSNSCGEPDGCGGTCMICTSGQCVDGECSAEPTGCGAVSFEGCCDGDTLKYCENDSLTTGVCEPGTCGWAGDAGFYNCGEDGSEDPSGNNPKACP